MVSRHGQCVQLFLRSSPTRSCTFTALYATIYLGPGNSTLLYSHPYIDQVPCMKTGPPGPALKSRCPYLGIIIACHSYHTHSVVWTIQYHCCCLAASTTVQVAIHNRLMPIASIPHPTHHALHLPFFPSSPPLKSAYTPPQHPMK